MWILSGRQTNGLEFSGNSHLVVRAKVRGSTYTYWEKLVRGLVRSMKYVKLHKTRIGEHIGYRL